MSLRLEENEQVKSENEDSRQIIQLKNFIGDFMFEKSIEVKTQTKFIEQLSTINSKIKEHEDSIENLDSMKRIVKNEKSKRQYSIEKLMKQNVLDELIKTRDFVSKQTEKTKKIIKEWDELIEQYKTRLSVLQSY